MKFYKLKVLAIDHPVKDAATITFDVPDHLYESFNYHPGQHLIIKFFVDGKEARRSYSLNSCPFKNEALQITVKRVKDGLVSNYVNNNLKVSDELEVMSPQGRFYATTKGLNLNNCPVFPSLEKFDNSIFQEPHRIEYGNNLNNYQRL